MNHHRIRRPATTQLNTSNDMKQFLLRGLRRGGISPAKMKRIVFCHKETKKVIGSCDSWDDFEKAFDDATECAKTSGGGLLVDIQTSDESQGLMLSLEREDDESPSK